MTHWIFMLFTMVLLVAILLVAGLDGGALVPFAVVCAVAVLLGIALFFRPSRPERH